MKFTLFALLSCLPLATQAQPLKILFGEEREVCAYASSALSSSEIVAADDWFVSILPELRWEPVHQRPDSTYTWLDIDNDGLEELVHRWPGFHSRIGTYTVLSVYELKDKSESIATILSKESSVPQWSVHVHGVYSLWNCQEHQICSEQVEKMIPGFRESRGLPEYKNRGNYYGMIASLYSPIFITPFVFQDRTYLHMRGPHKEAWRFQVIAEANDDALEVGYGIRKAVRDVCYLFTSE